jgi:hypothetical protein
LQTGHHGIQRGMQNLRKNAAQSADQISNPDAADPAGLLIDMSQSRLQVEASAKVAQTVSDTIDFLLYVEA